MEAPTDGETEQPHAKRPCLTSADHDDTAASADPVVAAPAAASSNYGRRVQPMDAQERDVVSAGATLSAGPHDPKETGSTDDESPAAASPPVKGAPEKVQESAAPQPGSGEGEGCNLKDEDAGADAAPATYAEEYEVERVVGERMGPLNTPEFLVKWKGWPDEDVSLCARRRVFVLCCFTKGKSCMLLRHFSCNDMNVCSSHPRPLSLSF